MVWHALPQARSLRVFAPGRSRPQTSHLFHLQAAEANVYESGSLQGANRENWPIPRLRVFNADAAEPKDDIGLAQSISSVPASVMAAVFGVDVSVFMNLPPVKNRLTILKRPNGQTGAK